jgi:hypothetical protein
MLAWAVQVARYAPQGAAITTALIVGVMRRFWAGRFDAVSVMVDRAIERGGHRSAAFMHEAVTERDADLGAAALAAARAGVLRTPPDSAG